MTLCVFFVCKFWLGCTYTININFNGIAPVTRYGQRVALYESLFLWMHGANNNILACYQNVMAESGLMCLGNAL